MMQHDERFRVSLSTSPGQSPRAVRPAEPEPLRILVVGDFTGRGGRDHTEPILVRDLHELLERLAPSIELELGGVGSFRFEPREIDDFHPDRLIERVPRLRALVAGIDEAVASRFDETTEAPEPARPRAPGDEDAAPSEGLLDEIVDDTPRVDAPAGSDMVDLTDLRAWMRSVARDHVVEMPSADEVALRQRLEREAAARIVEVLRAPAFRRLEALWRSLLFLLSNAPPPDVRVSVLPWSRSEVADDVGGEAPEKSGLARVLRERPDLVVAAIRFGPEVRDVALLNRLAMIAGVSGVPLAADADPGLLGLERFGPPPSAFDRPTVDAPAWDAFRDTPAARSVCLVAPGFLLRMPYGEGTDPCETLPVDETAAGDGDPWAWGHPAFVLAAAVALARQEGPPPFRPITRDFLTRPVVGTGESGDPVRSVESVWTDDDLAWVADCGVTPLAGARNEARLRVLDAVSAARPRTLLEASWRRR